MAKDDSTDIEWRQKGPFKPYETIFEEEITQAVHELRRPAAGLFISGLIAGSGIAVSILLLAVLLTHLGAEVSELMRLFLIANAYSVGFILVIMGRTDLFTEYSTIAILPVLIGRAPLRSLLRLWGLVFTGNLLGGAAFAALLVSIGPALGIIEPTALSELAQRLVDHSWQVILGSAFLTGWLMGLLAWLVIAARESISQAFFIWIIAASIGFAHLHHVITGAIEVLVGLISSDDISLADFGHFLLWTTLGNTMGGVVFAVLIRFSVPIQEATRARKRDQGRE